MSGLCPSAMIGLVFLLFPALLCSQSAASGNTLPAKIFTIPGQTVVLQLHRRITSDFPTVEWSKQGLDQYVIVYRDGRESDDLQNPVFRGRASLFKDQLKDGNISLKISDVQENDAGTYRCKLLQNQDQDNVEFELVVGVASEPTLTFVPAADGQVTLQCDSGCWFPCPNITFVDDWGEEIGAKEQKDEPRSGKCCSATRTVALETVTSNVSCRVRQTQINQMRLTQMFIPAKCLQGYSGGTCAGAAVVCSLVTGAVVGFVVHRCKKCAPVQRRKATRHNKDEVKVQIDEDDGSGSAPPRPDGEDDPLVGPQCLRVPGEYRHTFPHSRRSKKMSIRAKAVEQNICNEARSLPAYLPRDDDAYTASVSRDMQRRKNKLKKKN